MLHGLYFKLHDENAHECMIIDFFNNESKKLNISKIRLLILCIKCYHLAVKIYPVDTLMKEGEKV